MIHYNDTGLYVPNFMSQNPTRHKSILLNYYIEI